ncbi:MAG: dioxygenase [Acidobacteria bacterium]|nr:dioxygenase [Acidobacteriota bacterium]
MSEPAVFVSHGSPMAALEIGAYQDALAAFGQRNRPQAVVVVSAHWETGREVKVASAERQHLIYDFGGFPRQLYEVQYPAVGAPAAAQRVAELLAAAGVRVELDAERGLDHGVWVPLSLMFPQVDVPVVALPVPMLMTPSELVRVGEALRPLREEGVMILGSGGIVHNLRRLNWNRRQAPVEGWAAEFDTWFAEKLEAWDVPALARYAQDAPQAQWAVPTTEHFHPVFVTLGAAGERPQVEWIHQGFEYGTLSMRSFALR